MRRVLDALGLLVLLMAWPCGPFAGTIPDALAKPRICGNGIVDPGEQCDGGACCDARCAFVAPGTLCRPSAGLCDRPESCTGSSATCPDDAKVAAGVVCRASTGPCDVAETCDGTSNVCPADAFVSSRTVCRAAAGECDVAEACPGNAPNCPADAKRAIGTACTDDGNPCTTDVCDGSHVVCQHLAGNAGAVCRAAANECDLPETCTGSSPSCPTDLVRTAGTPCTDDGNVCTADVCNGTVGAPACVHNPGNAGTVCRAAAGACDVAETCTGSSSSCPPDLFQPSSTVCRAAAGACDLAERCAGNSSDCPADAKQATGTACTDDGNPCTTDACDGTSVTCQHTAGNPGALCRAAANECDLPESCTGSSSSCPTDLVRAAGTACADDGNVCTADVCNGTVGAPACVHNPGNAGTVCRAAAGACDVAETCTGGSPTCPPDRFQSSSTVCRTAAGECDLTETCPGNAPACPADAKQATGTACTDDGNPCTTDACDGTSVTCQHAAGNPGALCRAAVNECDLPETCTGTTPSCPTDLVKAAGTACTDDGNVCTTDVCNGTAGVPACVHDPGNAGTVCRAAAGACDVAEVCTGSSSVCPIDEFKSVATECRPAAGECDIAETCTGTTPTCPADTFKPRSVECRPAAGECDIAETCTGTSAACPADSFQPPAVECRPAAGACDIAETCTGTTATCPVDAFRSTTIVCRPSAGECDPAEHCSGSSASCPEDGKNPATTPCTDDGNPCSRDECDGTNDDCRHPAGNAGAVCRPAAGPCDVDEACLGTSTTCPADAFEPASVECRPTAGACDVAERCTGDSPGCPADVFASSSTVCRTAAGECDLAETCQGNGPDCPADIRQASGTACTGDGNPCTTHACDGTHVTCQHAAGNPGAVCRAAANECDLPETCTGSSPSCPTDLVKAAGTTCTDDGNICTTDVCNGTIGAPACVHDPGNAGTVCRAAAGECDVAETCPGNGPDCPADAKQVTETACADDGNPCTTDVCDGSHVVCQHLAGNAGAVCRAAANECDLPETCTGSSPSCPTDLVRTAGTACTDDGNVCTADVCNGTVGAPVCVHNPGNAGTVCRAAAGACDVAETCTGGSPTCPPDRFQSSSTVCRTAAGECDLTETCPGNAPACPADAKQASGTACTDDGNPCTTDACDGTHVTCQHTAGHPGAVCRAAANECDLPETCTGTTPSCPTDLVKAAGTACTDDGNVCTTDVCNGTAGAPACVHDPGNAGTVCRAAAGACDVAESCTGGSPTCPPDRFESSSTVCRTAAGECDLTETCPGNGPACPPDAKQVTGTACTDDGNPCTTDACDGTSVTCQHAAGNPGALCRAAAGACDVAEVCTGASSSCPADAFRPSSTVCRAAAGECDLGEFCSGNAPNCPPDAKKVDGAACTDDGNPCSRDECDGTSDDCRHPAGNAGTVCRAAAGSCDVDETCTGTSTACPPDAFQSSFVGCRPSAGECDPAENCTGTAPICPEDAKSPPGTACTDDGNPCTTDMCDGTSNDCQHPAGNAGTVCRPAAGDCDPVETCTGTSAVCPADAFEPADIVCRASAGECDPAELCTGSDAGCPEDIKGSASTPCADDGNPCSRDECDGTNDTCQHPAGNAGAVCRRAAGPCDVDEICTGTSATCPVDAFQPASVECRPAAGDCDVAESCTGAGPACPLDGFKPATVECRAAAGECDVAETCTGTSARCPSDLKSTAVCRPSAGPCDVAARCTGASDVCPDNAFKSDGAACDDGDVCTIADGCRGGICVGTTLPGCCQGDSACDDGIACTDDRCIGQACVHVPLDDRCGPRQDCAVPVCAPSDAAAGAEGCVLRPANDEAFCSEDGDPCTIDTCRSGGCQHASAGNADCQTIAGPFRAILALLAREDGLRVTVAAAAAAACPALATADSCALVSGKGSVAPRLVALLDAAHDDFQAANLALGGRLPGASAADAPFRSRLALGLLAGTPGKLRAFVATAAQARGHHLMAPAFSRARQTEARALLRATLGLRASLRRLGTTRRSFAR